MTPYTKQALIRWTSWYCLGNAILYGVAGLSHYTHALSYTSPEYALLTHWNKLLLIYYAISTYVTQYSLLAFTPGLLIIACIVFSRSKLVITSFSILLLSLTSLFVVTDLIAYHYQFHLNGFIISFIIGSFYESVFGLSLYEIGFCLAIILGIIFFEIGYAYYLWHQIIIKKKTNGMGKYLAVFVVICFYSSLMILLYSSNHPFIKKTLINSSRYLPCYNVLLANIIPMDNTKIVLRQNNLSYIIPILEPDLPLHYPKKSLNNPAMLEKPLNLVIIVIDSWRYDMLNSSVTPAITQFSQHAWQFTQHSSGGNATAPGIFSLFYSLPGTYWYAMEREKRGPVLIDALIKQQYQMGIFSSASLSIPNFKNTVFAAVDNLSAYTEGNSPYNRDITITNKFTDFVTHRRKDKPFFSFLFYDAAHTYCGVDEALKPLQPVIQKCQRYSLNNHSDPTPYFNRYKNALMLVDQRIKQILELLKKQGLLDNTVVMITGDHGEEFNDNHTNHWGHANSFTPYQVQTPLILYWPHSQHKIISHHTSHYDIAPSLIKMLLHNKVAFSHYSIGEDLLNPQRKPYIIISSYTDFAIKEENQITKIQPNGEYEITELNGSGKVNASLHLPIIKKVLSELNYFYR